MTDKKETNSKNKHSESDQPNSEDECGDEACGLIILSVPFILYGAIFMLALLNSADPQWLAEVIIVEYAKMDISDRDWKDVLQDDAGITTEDTLDWEHECSPGTCNALRILTMLTTALWYLFIMPSFLCVTAGELRKVSEARRSKLSVCVKRICTVIMWLSAPGSFILGCILINKITVHYSIFAAAWVSYTTYIIGGIIFFVGTGTIVVGSLNYILEPCCTAAVMVLSSKFEGSWESASSTSFASTETGLGGGGSSDDDIKVPVSIGPNIKV